MAELKERTFLRGIALQALYEYDLSDHNVTDILTNRFDSEDVPDDELIKDFIEENQNFDYKEFISKNF